MIGHTAARAVARDAARGRAHHRSLSGSTPAPRSRGIRTSMKFCYDAFGRSRRRARHALRWRDMWRRDIEVVRDAPRRGYDLAHKLLMSWTSRSPRPMLALAWRSRQRGFGFGSAARATDAPALTFDAVTYGRRPPLALARPAAASSERARRLR